MSPTLRSPRPLSRGEEIANSVTHGVGLLASLVALPVLVVTAGRSDTLHAIGASIFATSLVLLYAASTIYHALPPSRAKQVFRVLDHVAIYLLIAGTYTPFTLGVLRGASGWILFGLIWSLAVAGIVSKTLFGFRHPRASTVFYVAMGWAAVLAIRPIMAQVPAPGLAWLLAGGLLYTGGVAFFVRQQQRHHHAVWHCFVLGGSTCHFFAVLWYAAPVAL